MYNFKLSAFADEYSPDFAKQLEGLRDNGVGFMEIRGVNGKSIADVTPGEAVELKKMLDDAGIGVSCIGSPIGKIRLNGDFNAHLETLRRICETAAVLGTSRIRMFSFYGGDKPVTECKNEVVDKIGRLLGVAEPAGMLLCHENEKGIYGELPERCAELLDAFPTLGCVFDHANFIQAGATPYPDGYELLKKRITYFHIKDALGDGSIVPAGKGIGRIAETIADFAEYKGGEIVLTVEPHLRVFAGLDALEGGERTKLGNAYATSAEAFAAAVAGLRSCLA